MRYTSPQSDANAIEGMAEIYRIKKAQALAEWGFPELSESENLTIVRARIAGFAGFFPAYPSATAQAINTLAAGKEFLEGLNHG